MNRWRQLGLQLYLRAQRVVGAARTASIFATAPFAGLAVAVLMGTPWPSAVFGLTAGRVAIGLWLHSTERHDHVHAHTGLEHDRMHVHDDRDHEHLHDPMPLGPHAHRHRHESVSDHDEHSEDVHHHHRH